MSPHEILAEHVVDIHKIVADFRDPFERIRLPLFSHMASTNIFLTNHFCRKDSVSRTGTLGPAWKGTRVR